MGERLSLKETAKRLGIAESTLREWIRERKFPVQHLTAYRRGCDWDDVAQWITAQATVAAPPEPGRRLRIARHQRVRKNYPRTR
jgi:predicted DNA-binding transcriptional regulator AlpA